MQVFDPAHALYRAIARDLNRTVCVLGADELDTKAAFLGRVHGVFSFLLQCVLKGALLLLYKKNRI